MDKEAIAKKHISAYYHHKGRSVSLDDILPMSRIYPMMDEYSTELRKENEDCWSKINIVENKCSIMDQMLFDKDKEIERLHSSLLDVSKKTTDKIAEQQRTIDEFRVLLEECEEYMDDRSDADNGIPNKEMNMLCEIQSLLSKQ